MNHSEHEPPRPFSSRQSSLTFILIFLLAIGGFFLIGQHWEHFLAIFPWLLALLCPLMHLFMHGDHGGHDRHNHTDSKGGDNSDQGSH